MKQSAKFHKINRTSVGNQLSWLAVAFLFLFSLVLTLSPVVKYRSWSANLVWAHWIGFLLWCIGFYLFRKITGKYLNTNDHTIIPAIGLLIGWGILTIWRIYFIFGMRQSIWFLICVGSSYLFFKHTEIIDLVKKYKYLLLAFGLVLSALTFLFGTYPGGEGPRLWLGTSGLYFQPSELLKLILILYLSAFFSENYYSRIKIIQTIFPTIILILAALFILIAQRDLGTALIFISIYIFILFITFGKKRILAIGLLLVLFSAVVGYFFIDLIRIRFQGWVIPWSDTQAGSYQITQSIIAIATGGLLGTGIGLGNPRLIPIAHSDFIFSAIVEETGLFGAIGLIILFLIILFRGFSIAIKTHNIYYRYLSAGLSLYLTSQAILIIGGNIRLLPITGVTLPFLSYGGSSLIISFLAICVLLSIDSNQTTGNDPHKGYRSFQLLGLLFSVSFFVISLVVGWWAIIRSNDLQLRADNPRHMIASRFVKRGRILDRNDSIIVSSEGDIGQLIRVNHHPPLSNTVGFFDSTYGSSGLELSQDAFLSGEKGVPAFDMWFNHLLFDQPLPGRDIRLTLDLNLQKAIDSLLEPYEGSAVVLNAENGDILAIVSHPYINSNNLKENWTNWKADPDSPFLNRAIQGAYPIGGLFSGFLLSEANISDLPQYDSSLTFNNAINLSSCAISTPKNVEYNLAVNNGCHAALIQSVGIVGSENILQIVERFMLDQTPAIILPDSLSSPRKISDKWSNLLFGDNPLRVNPLQISASLSAITYQGEIPSPQIISAVDSSSEGWVFISRKSSKMVISKKQAEDVNNFLKSMVINGWEITARGADSFSKLSWYASGTPANWSGTPITVVLALEDQNPFLTRAIGRKIFNLSVN